MAFDLESSVGLGVKAASTQDGAEDEGRDLKKPSAASVVLGPRSCRFLSSSPGLWNQNRGQDLGICMMTSSAGAHL